MSRWAICILTFALSVASVADDKTREWTKIRLASDGTFPPFNAIDASGNLHGFDIDIGNALCIKMKVKCEWVIQPWEGIIPALNSGRVDVIIASMQIMPLRKRAVAFTDPYQHVPAVLIAEKILKRESWEPKDFSEYLVGAAASTVNANFLQGEVMPLGGVLKLYPTQHDLFRDLAAGRLDVAATDLVVANQWLADSAGACCEIKAEIDRHKYHRYYGDGTGIALRKGDDLLLKMFNKALSELKKSGEYKRINDQYFAFSIE